MPWYSPENLTEIFKHIEASAALATWVGVLVNAALLLVIWRSVVVSKAAVAAANSSVKIAQDMGVQQTRAYVSLVRASITNLADSGASSQICIEFKNAGMSPAFVTKMLAVSGFTHEPFLRESVEKLEVLSTNRIFGPNQETTFYIAKPGFPAGGIEGFPPQKRFNGFVRIRVEYTDVFNVDRVSDFTRATHENGALDRLYTVEGIADIIT